MRRYLLLMLAGLVLFTAQGAAVARTMPDAVGRMIICTGSGPVMVYTDADGVPTDAPHLCPDYALGLIVALAAPQMDAPRGLAWTPVRCVTAADACVAAPRAAPSARAPPLAI